MAAGTRAQDVLRDAVDALRRGAWSEGRAKFEAVLELDPSPEAYDGLATCCRFLGALDESLTARERAYRLYRDRGDAAGATIAAAWLGRDSGLPRGEGSVARSWVAVARRQLAKTDSSLARGTVDYYEVSSHCSASSMPPRLAISARRLAPRAASAATSTSRCKVSRWKASPGWRRDGRHPEVHRHARVVAGALDSGALDRHHPSDGRRTDRVGQDDGGLERLWRHRAPGAVSVAARAPGPVESRSLELALLRRSCG